MENKMELQRARRAQWFLMRGKRDIVRMMVVVAVSVPGTLVMPGVAQAAGEGSIEGTVTKAGGGALADLRVCALPTTGSLVCGLTNVSGMYKLTRLEAGAYYIVRFTGRICPGGEGKACHKKYVTQYYEDKPSFEQADHANKVEATSSPRTGINASLEEGGRITGAVTAAAAGHEPVSGMWVCAVDKSFDLEDLVLEAVEGNGGNCVATNERGEYLIEGLAEASYEVAFTGDMCLNETCSEVNEEYALQYYDDKPSEAEATPVPIAGGATAERIDASMVAGGSTTTTISTATTSSTSAGATTTHSVTTSSGSTTTPAPGRAIASGPAAVEHGNAAVSLHCTGAGPCEGTIKLVVSETRGARRHGRLRAGRLRAARLHHGKRRHGKSPRGKRRKVVHKRTVVIGEASFSIAAGASETVTVHLTAKGRTLLRKSGKRGLKVSVSGSGVQSTTLTLKEAGKAAKKPGKRHRRGTARHARRRT